MKNKLKETQPAKKQATPKKPQSLLEHEKRIGNTVFFIDDNEIISGIVEQYTAVGDRETTLITYLVKNEFTGVDGSYYYKDCFDSLTELIDDLKNNYFRKITEK